MKKIPLYIFIFLSGATLLRADDQMRTVQEQLKNQGFYYGQVDGQGGAETTAAIRRYQIRSGLQVTGTLTPETVNSLNAAGNATAAQPQAPVDNSQPQQTAPVDTQPQPQPQAPPNATQSDRDFLKTQDQRPVSPPPPAVAPRDNANVVSPPVEVPGQASVLAEQYAALFARTPFENAPVEVQQSTLRNAQLRFARDRYYDSSIDGIPGPATTRAIILFQNDAGLAQTGRLDLDTLNQLRLLPAGRRVVSEPVYPPQGYPAPPLPRPQSPRVYRGLWVH